MGMNAVDVVAGEDLDNTDLPGFGRLIAEVRQAKANRETPDIRALAERHKCSRTHVQNAVFMDKHTAPSVLALIVRGCLSEYVALETMRVHGDEAELVLMRAWVYAQAQGATKIMPKHIEGMAVRGMQKSMGPKMASLLEKIRRDPAYKDIAQPMRRQVNLVLEEFRIKRNALRGRRNKSRQNSASDMT